MTQKYSAHQKGVGYLTTGWEIKGQLEIQGREVKRRDRR
jgi:hypothetical protein